MVSLTKCPGQKRRRPVLLKPPDSTVVRFLYLVVRVGCPISGPKDPGSLEKSQESFQIPHRQIEVR